MSLQSWSSYLHLLMWVSRSVPSCLFLYIVLGIKPTASCMSGTHSTTWPTNWVLAHPLFERFAECFSTELTKHKNQNNNKEQLCLLCSEKFCCCSLEMFNCSLALDLELSNHSFTDCFLEERTPFTHYFTFSIFIGWIVSPSNITHALRF